MSNSFSILLRVGGGVILLEDEMSFYRPINFILSEQLPSDARQTGRVNLSTYGGRAFAYIRRYYTCWNSLPDNLKNENLSLQTFKRYLNTYFISSY